MFLSKYKNICGNFRQKKKLILYQFFGAIHQNNRYFLKPDPTFY